jgi:hypothetical protein
VPPFRGGALTPVVVSRLSPGTQWAALRRELDASDTLDDLDVAAGLSRPASVPQMADPPPGSAAVARTAAWAAATRATGMRKGEQET